MPYKLLPPGTRHGNRVYYVRISVPGCRVEGSTGTADAALARRYAEKRERELYEQCVLNPSQGTVADAINRYIKFRRPRKRDEFYLLAIRRTIGCRPLPVGQADFDHCSQTLYPGLSNETWNRCVYTPLQAALHHSGCNVKIRRPKQRRPRHKSLTAKERDRLIEAATGQVKVLLTLLFYAGPRISEAVSLTWDRVDLKSNIVCFQLSKVDREHWRPLHPKVSAALRKIRKDSGKVFTWKTREGASCKIRKLARELNIKFHPHMARHTFADLFMEKGGSVRDLMDAGGWTDVESAMRYTGRRVERLRKAIARL